MKMPSMQFYPADWRKDPGIQCLTYEERGIWLEILFLMHESDQRGKLLLNGRPIPESRLAQILHIDNQKITTTITTLLELGVASLCPDTGALMNRRMIRDDETLAKKREAGKSGGNPLFNKGKPNPYYQKEDNQKDNHEHNQQDNQKDNLGDNQKITPSSSVSSSSSISSSSSSSISDSISSSKKTTLSTKVDRVSSEVMEIFEFWKVELNHQKSALDQKRLKAIKLRLKEGYSVERIKEAIVGIQRSAHNMGVNDTGTVYDDIELICRSGANVDRFADMRQGENQNTFKAKEKIRSYLIGEYDDQK